MIMGAIIDESGQYRYLLLRTWDATLPKVLFVMLNPSTADHEEDDPTIRRCIGFAKKWGFGTLEVVNLFAFRATDPDELKRCTDPIGPDNDMYIRRAALQADRIVLAWGTKGRLFGRDKKVRELLSSFESVYYLDLSKKGHPRHPLFIPAICEPKLINA